ncbi:hypothetical protein M8R46_20290, partial [Enterobacter hormaechei]|nr:hypothetical protein [Enterobacter hormaechei]
HGDVLMWLMKTLLTSGCTNQRGAGQNFTHFVRSVQVLLKPVLGSKFFFSRKNFNIYAHA